MSHQVTELTFLKHFAPRFSVPTPEFLEWPASRQEIHDALLKWGKAIVKPDIIAGGRGKAGAVAVVESTADAIKAMQDIGHIELKRHAARTSYMVQFINSPSGIEVYSAITYDSRFLSPAITLSLKGGMDIESVSEEYKKTFPINVYRGLDAYQAQDFLQELKCPKNILSPMSRALVNQWDMFITSGMKMCEINPWRISPKGTPVACDFKAVMDPANFKQRDPGFEWPEYPEAKSDFEEEMQRWNALSYQGQAHVSDIGGKGVLPILFGGGASTIITETLMSHGGDPMFLADFGGNPPYERMKGTAELCFKHNLDKCGLLLILGGKANNTLIDVTFAAIADALTEHVNRFGTKPMPVIIGRGGPRLVTGLLTMERALEELGWPYVIFFTSPSRG